MLAPLLVALTTLGAEPAGPPLLIAMPDLARRLDEPQLRLVDVRSRAAYARAHMPGAVWADTKKAEAIASRPGGLTDRAAWEAWIGPLGIGTDTTVYVYGE